MGSGYYINNMDANLYIFIFLNVHLMSKYFDYFNKHLLICWQL